MKKNIMITIGGKSVEHDISIITGVQVANLVSCLDCNVFVVYIDKSNQWHLFGNIPKIEDFNNLEVKTKNVVWNCGQNKLFLLNKKCTKSRFMTEINFVILCNHGQCGEDGTLQGLFQLSGVAFSSSDNVSSAITMDKCIMKDIFVANNIPTLDYINVTQNDNFDIIKNEIIKKFSKQKLIIKPAKLGSSIGIDIVDDINNLKFMVDKSFMFDTKILIEKYLTNFIEINCSVRFDKDGKVVASCCETPSNLSKFYSFYDKYCDSNSFRKTKKQNCTNNKICSNVNENKCLISNEVQCQIKELSIKVYKLFNCNGIVRVDFLFDNVENKLYVNEINSIPGSFSVNLWNKSKISGVELIKDLISNGEHEFVKKKNKISTFSSSVLDYYK